MTKHQTTASNAQNDPDRAQGEGSYSGTHRYNERLKKHVDSGKSEELAEEAKRALEGDERGELEDAERRAKRGPVPQKSKVSQR
jgi:hypothetical protein